VLERARGKLERARTGIHRARRRRRVERVENAASEAGRYDELLSPDGVRTAAEALFRLVHLSWREHHRGRLGTLLGPEMLPQWEERLDKAFGDVPADLVGDVRVDYVSFTTGQAPRAVVLVEAVLRKDGEMDAGMRLCQYWTLGVRDGLWTVLDIEDRGQGRYHLLEPVGVPTPV
jgi:hypothetical protein